jgi:6,7-dimethyl-8-ribityllumazine synthase
MAGLMNVALDHALALGSGVLTVHSIEQAVARSGRDGFNKGAEAAVAALVQINAARRFGIAP